MSLQGENVPGNVTTVAQEKRVDDTNLVAATGMRTITENAVGREIVIVRGIGTVTGKERGRGNTGTVSRKGGGYQFYFFFVYFSSIFVLNFEAN